MSVSEETKLRWFDRGAVSLADVWPKLVEAAQASVYICPQCFDGQDLAANKLFLRSAVETGVLTAEHVPPGCFDGKELVLTCGSCNHMAGSRIEAHARKRENLAEALGGGSGRPTRVHIKAGEHTVAATLRLDSKTWDLKLPSLDKHANDPRAVEGLQTFLQSGAAHEQGLRVSFHEESHNAQAARVCWLRAAYLVMFAIAGYRYVFSSGLELVRKQIQEPDAEHIPTFLAVIPGVDSWRTRRIMRIREPEWQRCWAVQIGRNVAFLPTPGDTELYARLAEESQRRNGQARVTAQEAVEWPTWPTFGIEL